MRSWMVLFASMVALINFAYAETRTPIPAKGDALSYLHGIVSIHEARSEADHIRVYGISIRNGTALQVALSVTAGMRPPSHSKLSRVAAWKLGANLRRVDSVAFVDTTVIIKGWSFDSGAMTCVSVLKFKDGILENELDDRGCSRDEAR